VLSFAQAGTWANAITLWEHAIKVNPRSGPAQVNLGRAYGGAMRPLDAFRVYKKAAEDAPNDPHLRANYGSALGDIGEFDAAEVEFRAALKIDPNHELALRGMATLQAIRILSGQQPATQPSTVQPGTRPAR
jgi:Tfp pilus assembly protein PilF